jgi:hypothetical protein
MCNYSHSLRYIAFCSHNSAIVAHIFSLFVKLKILLRLPTPVCSLEFRHFCYGNAKAKTVSQKAPGPTPA